MGSRNFSQSIGRKGCGLILGMFVSIVLLLFNGINNNNNNNNIDNNNNGLVQRFLSNTASEKELEFEGLFMTCVALLLIALTILFEWVKHTLEHSVSDEMEPIIEKLFGEMTVLGFLSMVTFLLHSGGFFELLSDRIFGDEEETEEETSHRTEELVEVFEWVHFSIFFIMLFFMIQVVVLIRQAIHTEATWMEFNRDYRQSSSEEEARSSSTRALDNNNNNSVLSKFWGRLRQSNSYLTLLPFFRNEAYETEVSRAYFRALRDEFLEDRSTKPPYRAAPKRLKYDFVFGRYLGLCLTRFLARVVDVTNTTLTLMAVGAVLFFLWSLVLDENTYYLAWSWLCVGWAHLLFNVYFEQHILEIRKQLVPEGSPHLVSLVNSFNATSSSLQQQQKTPFQSISEKDLTLPGWCSVDLEKYLKGRSKLRNVFVKGTPNRQDTLYWMDRYGPTLYLIILQSNLIFIGLDFATQLMFFLPTMYNSEASRTSFVVYLVLAVLSISGNMLNKKHLVANLAVVCSVGSLRNINAIADVFQEEKTENLVRCFLVIYRLHRVASRSAPVSSKGDDGHYTTKLDPLEIREVSQTFNNFACITEDDGYISYEEFRLMMSTLGGSISENMIQTVMSSMDHSDDGQIDRSEFLQWYSNNILAVEETDLLQNAPRVLFELFDEDNQGEISISQFQQKLDKLQVGFGDQISIINEIDRDGNGQITSREFEMLFRRFPPAELLRKNNNNNNRAGQSSSLGLCSDVPHCGGSVLL